MKALMIAAVLALVLVGGCASGSQQGSGDGLHSTVPNVTGMQLEPARDSIMAAGYRLGSVTEKSVSGRNAGIVMEQSPVAGTSLARGADVNITITK